MLGHYENELGRISLKFSIDDLLSVIDRSRVEQNTANRETIVTPNPEKPVHKNWYEDVRVLSVFLESATDSVDALARLNVIESERRTAGYKRGERLQELDFYGGRWSGDSVGNMMRTTSELPAELVEACPVVMTREDFRKKIIEIAPELTYWQSIEGALPAGLCCAECHKPWDITDADVFVSERSFRDVPLNDYIGWRLADAAQDLKEKNAGRQIWVLQSDLALRNDTYIDHTMRIDYPALEVNGSGYIRGDQSDHIIEEGDEANFNIWEYRHPDCSKKHKTEEGWNYFVTLLSEVGYNVSEQQRNFSLHLSENKYDHDETNSWPWVTLVVPNGVIEVGLRHRVFSISIEENYEGSQVDLTALFAQEDVTKGRHFIHAWGRDKAIEYLTAIKLELEKLGT